MKIIKNYLYSLSNQITTLLVPLLTIPYISRVLGTYGVGLNAYTNSIISYFVLFGTIGITTYGNRTISALRDDKVAMSKAFWELIYLRFFLIIISFLFFIIFIYYYKIYMHALLIQSILLISAAFDISWLLMGIEDFKKTAIRDFFVKLISLVCIFSFVKKSSDVYIYIYILTLSQFLSNVSLWFYLKKIVLYIPFSNIKFFGHLNDVLRFFIPQVAIQIYVILNKTMLGYMKGVHDVALYENSYKIVQVILTLVTAIGVITLPSLTNSFSKNDKDKMNSGFKSVFEFTCFLSFPLSVGLYLVSKDLSYLFFGSKFIGIESTIQILSPVILLISFGIILGQYFIAINKIHYLTISVTIGAVLSIAINYFLIAKNGAVGAGLATVITEALVTVMQLYFIRKYTKLHFLTCFLRYCVPSLFMYIIIFFSFSDDYNYFNLFMKITSGVFVYLFFILIFNPSIFEKVRVKISNVFFK